MISKAWFICNISLTFIIIGYSIGLVGQMPTCKPYNWDGVSGLAVTLITFLASGFIAGYFWTREE